MAEDTKQNLEELQRVLACTVRAVAHDAKVEVAFRGRERGQVAAAATAPAVRLALPRPDLILHELGTNSMKYGALSVPEGRVDVSWTLEPGADGARVRFEWLESGGPPVARPSRSGFGTRLLERGIARELDGTAELDYRKEGLSFRLEFPLDDAIAHR